MDLRPHLVEGLLCHRLKVEKKPRSTFRSTAQDSVPRDADRSRHIDHHAAVARFKKPKPVVCHIPDGFLHLAERRPPGYIRQIDDNPIRVSKQENPIGKRFGRFQHQSRFLRMHADTYFCHFRRGRNLPDRHPQDGRQRNAESYASFQNTTC